MKKLKDAIALLAVSKLIKSDDLVEVKKHVGAGEYDVDFLARFKGKIQIGDGYNQKIVAKADPWKLLALALSKLNGITINSLVNEAEIVEIDTESLKEQATDALARIKAPTMTVCQGKTTGNVSINVESADIKIVN